MTDLDGIPIIVKVPRLGKKSFYNKLAELGIYHPGPEMPVFDIGELAYASLAWERVKAKNAKKAAS